MTASASVSVPAVPRLYPGACIAVLASGPSLKAEQVARVKASGVPSVAIKDVARLLLPDASVLYACDRKWWKHYGPGLAAFRGLRYALEETPHAICLRNTGMTGIDPDPTGLRTGKNSGYQAVNLAVHLGASRIVLLGFDMQAARTGDHFFGQHRYPGAVNTRAETFRDFREAFETAVEPLQRLGVEVVNASPGSALTAFPQASLEEALA